MTLAGFETAIQCMSDQGLRLRPRPLDRPSDIIKAFKLSKTRWTRRETRILYGDTSSMYPQSIAYINICMCKQSHLWRQCETFRLCDQFNIVRIRTSENYAKELITELYSY
jgi:hypothetical protein